MTTPACCGDPWSAPALQTDSHPGSGRESFRGRRTGRQEEQQSGEELTYLSRLRRCLQGGQLLPERIPLAPEAARVLFQFLKGLV